MYRQKRLLPQRRHPERFSRHCQYYVTLTFIGNGWKPSSRVMWSKGPYPIISLGNLFPLFHVQHYIVDPFALECMGGEKFANWTKITVEELHAYMGFMSLVKAYTTIGSRMSFSLLVKDFRQDPAHHRQAYQVISSPGNNISIDEARYHSRVAHHSNSVCPGIKYGDWMMLRLGNYLANIEVYTGKQGITTERSLGSRVVKTLTSICSTLTTSSPP